MFIYPPHTSLCGHRGAHAACVPVSLSRKTLKVLVSPGHSATSMKNLPLTALALTSSVRLPPAPAPCHLQGCFSPTHGSASSSKELNNKATNSLGSVTMRLLVPLKHMGQTLLSLKAGVLCLSSVKGTPKPAVCSRNLNPSDREGGKRDGLRYLPASLLKPQILMLPSFAQQVILQT